VAQERADRISRLLSKIPELSEYRLGMVEKIIDVFSQPRTYRCLPSSDIISEAILEDLGDVLRLHHCFSREPFSKDKFEYALAAILQTNGVNAVLAPRGRRGYDISIAGKRTSLKTEAAAAIRTDMIHISKFMELGGGHWGDNPEDLIGLRQQFLENLANTDRILILRALKKGNPDFLYELVEVPKRLLQRATTGRFEMRLESKQFPKPGYCYVEKNGELLFCLYFDGGGERKLQIKYLNKILCLSHATWHFLPTASVG
jgi:Type II site-specific deoxyribonuclease